MEPVQSLLQQKSCGRVRSPTRKTYHKSSQARQQLEEKDQLLKHQEADGMHFVNLCESLGAKLQAIRYSK